MPERADGERRSEPLQRGFAAGPQTASDRGQLTGAAECFGCWGSAIGFRRIAVRCAVGIGLPQRA